MTKLSFIVPVYNVAPYLRKCVDSLIHQDFSDYEIVLIDDGSTDESGKICDEYLNGKWEMSNAKSVPIRVIHQPNAGLSAARNAGVKCAEGKYICFVDSDDYWEPNVLGGLMEQVEREQLDVLRFDYQNVRVVDAKHLDAEHIDARRLEYEVFEPNKTPRYIDKCNGIVDGETYLNTRMSYACYAVMFILRRAIILNLKSEIINHKSEIDDCLFTPGIHFEDTEWTPRMLLNAKRVNSTPKIVYNYFWRNGSITKEYSKEHIKKKIQSLMQVNLSLQRLLQLVHDKRWINGCIADNVYAILNSVTAYDYDSASYWINMIKEDKMLPLQGYKVRKVTISRYRIINISPYLYCWLRRVRIKYLR